MALTATNPYGNNTNTKNNYITVGQRAGGELLRHADERQLLPLAVTFTDSSTNTPDRVVVELRRLNTSTVQNPSHTYIRRAPTRWR